MRDDTQTRDRGVTWFDLVAPRRSLERRVRRHAHLDALRGVQGVARRGVRYPATIGEIAAWEASTIRALGGHARRLAGDHDARIDSLQSRIVALGPPPEQRLVPGGRVAAVGTGWTPVSASHPEAQARRRTRLDAHLWAAADTERVKLQAELAEELARRAATIDTACEAARQCHDSSRALQHLYWAVRTRWSRHRHGAPPAATFEDVPLPEWVTAPELLYGVRRRDGSAA